jgi:hypothetical protein
MAGLGGSCHWAAKPDRLQSAFKRLSNFQSPLCSDCCPWWVHCDLTHCFWKPSSEAVQRLTGGMTGWRGKVDFGDMPLQQSVLKCFRSRLRVGAIDRSP